MAFRSFFRGVVVICGFRLRKQVQYRGCDMRQIGDAGGRLPVSPAPHHRRNIIESMIAYRNIFNVAVIACQDNGRRVEIGPLQHGVDEFG